MKRLAAIGLLLLAAPRASGQAPEPDAEPINDSDGYTPPVQGGAAPSPWTVNGYVDVGFAKAQGNGSSFAAGDQSVPADYGVDTFAPAVNSRGDVASTDAGGRFVNGFLPRSVGHRRERLVPAQHAGRGPAIHAGHGAADGVHARPASASLHGRGRRHARLRRAGVRPLHPLREPGAGAERGQVRLGLRHRVPGQPGEHPNRGRPLAGGPLHDRTVDRGQAVLSHADPGRLVGGQPERRGHQQRQLRRGAAAARTPA